MKSYHTPFQRFVFGAVAALFLGVGAAFAGQADDQIAVQLGAIQLGINVNTATPQQLANALVQGRAAIKLTAKNQDANKAVAVNVAAIPDVQSDTFRAQLLQATELALASPLTKLTEISKITVNLSNGKTTTVTAKLDPTKTTASALSIFIGKRIPNFYPGLAEGTVAAAMALVNPTTPRFGKVNADPAKLYSAQLKDAGKAAGDAMKAALKTYARGTINWEGYPTKTGSPLAPSYLPNFGTKGLGPKTAPPVLQQASFDGITDAAAAVAANAINGLGQTVNGNYGKTAANVQSLTTALVKSAVRYQKTSVTLSNLAGSDILNKSAGTVGATALGIVAQVAGVSNADWNANAGLKAILDGVVLGAVKASKSNTTAIVSGVAAGFVGTYIKTTMTPDQTAFITTNDNATKIANSFVTAGAFKVASDAYTSAIAAINAIFADAFANGLDRFAGAGGIHDFTDNNGVGSPVTDTVGL